MRLGANVSMHIIIGKFDLEKADFRDHQWQ